MRSGFLGDGIGPNPFGGGRVPPTPVPVAGAELIVNGDFTDGDSGWGYGLHWTFAAGAATHAPVSATGLTQSVLPMEHLWYATSYEIIAVSSGHIALSPGYGISGGNNTSAGTYFETLLSFPIYSTYLYLNAADAFDGTIDNVSCKPLILASLISTRPYASADCDISAAVTRTAGTQAGFAVRVDDPANPQNFIIAYLDGAGNLKTDKCLAGVYTNIAGLSGAVTYVAGQRPRIVCAGNDVSVYYNGVQVGSTTAVADAGITGNKNHGLFSTYAANTFTGYTAA